MAGSTYGKLFKITTWGESHGPGIGVVIDGCPAGLTMNEAILQGYLDKRRPGLTKYSTPRKEPDTVEILSGVFEGRTAGTPLSLLIRNQFQQSGDYSALSDCYRPGHADYTLDQKYGFRDYRGGGRSSGRETIGRVAGGAVACEILKQLHITVTAYVRSIGPISIDYHNCAIKNIEESPLRMPDLAASRQAEEYLLELMKEGDSAGGVVECILSGIPAGIGEPVFDKLDSSLAKGIMSIGAVKGVDIGDGIEAAGLNGSACNDGFRTDENGKIKKTANHAGGILGGMSDGSEILLKAYFKPTPSIAKSQQSVSRAGENMELSVGGRHDPVIVPRAVAVVEAMCAITLVDLLFQSIPARMEHLAAYFNPQRHPDMP